MRDGSFLEIVFERSFILRKLRKWDSYDLSIYVELTVVVILFYIFFSVLGGLYEYYVTKFDLVGKLVEESECFSVSLPISRV